MKKLVILNSIFVAALCAYVVYTAFQPKRKVAYVDTIKVFNEYKFKKELEKSTMHALQGPKDQLDSLTALYNADPANGQLKEMVYVAEGRFSDTYSRLNKEINEKVWMKLNDLVQQYGKEKECDLIIGANGMGTVLYGTPEMDLTNDLIQYVNKQYEG